MIPNPKRKIGLVVSAIIIILLIIALGAYFLLTGVLEITKLPSNASVLINGREYSGQTEVRKRLLAGDYLVQINAPDHTPYWQKIKLKNASTTLIEEPIIPLIASKPLAQNVSMLDKSPFNDKKYYFVSEGVLFESDNDFNNIPKTPRTVHNVQKISWSPSGQLALLFQGQKTELYDFRRYDIISQTIVDWGTEIKEALWLDEENIISYYQMNSGEKNLVLTNHQRTKHEVIADLRNYVDNSAKFIMVPASQSEIYIIGKDLIKVNIATREVVPITTSGNLISGAISPDKKYIALTTASGLTYYNTTTNQTVDIKHAGTINAFAWYGDKLYAISEGRLFISSAQLLEPMYFNQTPSEILLTCDEIVVLDRLIAIKSNGVLYNINIK